MTDIKTICRLIIDHLGRDDYNNSRRKLKNMSITEELLALLERVETVAAELRKEIRDMIINALEYVNEVCTSFEPCSPQQCLDDVIQCFKKAKAATA